jgi:hypothetical protein
MILWEQQERKDVSGHLKELGFNLVSGYANLK